MTALAYPGQLSAFDDSLARFEGLRRFIPSPDEAPAMTGRPKRVFRAEAAFVDPWVEAGRVGGVFFPQVVPGLAQSELVAVPPTEAMLQLIPQGVEGWDKATIGQSMQLLSRLVEQAPCYSLRLSPHVEQLPAVIADGIAYKG